MIIDQRQQTEGVRAPARGPVPHVTFDSLYATAVTGLRLDYVPQTADLCSRRRDLTCVKRLLHLKLLPKYLHGVSWFVSFCKFGCACGAANNLDRTKARACWHTSVQRFAGGRGGVSTLSSTGNSPHVRVRAYVYADARVSSRTSVCMCEHSVCMMFLFLAY